MFLCIQSTRFEKTKTKNCLTRRVKVEEPVQPRPAGKGWCSQQCQQYKPPAAQEETAILVQYDVKPEVPNLC